MLDGALDLHSDKELLKTHPMSCWMVVNISGEGKKEFGMACPEIDDGKIQYKSVMHADVSFMDAVATGKVLRKNSNSQYHHTACTEEGHCSISIVFDMLFLNNKMTMAQFLSILMRAGIVCAKVKKEAPAIGPIEEFGCFNCCKKFVSSPIF